MTLTRRQTLIGAAATVAAAAMPAVAFAEVSSVQRSHRIAIAVMTWGDEPPSAMAKIWKDYKRRLLFKWRDGAWDLVGDMHPDDGYECNHYAGAPAETFSFCGRAFEPENNHPEIA
jgi:hypothetical protein